MRYRRGSLFSSFESRVEACISRESVSISAIEASIVKIPGNNGSHAKVPRLKELHALAWQTLTEPSPLVIFERMKQKLTPKTIEHLATQDRRKEVWDVVLPGFGVRVYPTGRKTFFVMARVDGRQKRVTIGNYPAVALKDARDQARAIMRDVQLGTFEETVAESAPTFAETVPKFIELHAKPRNRDWRGTERILTSKFKPIEGKPLDQIKRSDVVRILDDIIGDGTPYRANRSLAAIKKLFSWALNRGMIEVHPLAGLSLPHPEMARDRVLSDDELAALMATAEDEGYPFGHMFQVLAFTGQRRGEVSGMRWSEIDLDRAMWTIPVERSKNKHSHDVPLAPQVVDILRSMPRFVGSDLVFTTTGVTPVSGFGKVKKRIDEAMGADDWRVHDLRRTAASGMARLSVQPHVVEKILNHRTGVISGVAAVYNRYGYETEKREALERWAAHIAGYQAPVGADVDARSDHRKDMARLA